MKELYPETNSSGEESMLAIFKESWPPLFCGKELDKLTGKTLQWRTIQNRRAQREIPENCFTKVSSRKVIVLRDPFLAWLATDMHGIMPAPCKHLSLGLCMTQRPKRIIHSKFLEAKNEFRTF